MFSVLFFKFIYLEREIKEGAERQGKRELQTGSALSAQSPTQD